ncbi:MAG: aromatic ring-hydroxylating dioxygenase subunit alpha [Planctomycetota bacterium]
MFENATHLPQRLQADDYTCPDIHQQELETCFLKGWQFLGDASQLKNEGDFFTTELFGHPLICWKQGGEPETFLNVCSHRLCTITDKQTGNFEKRMRCQYHSWEFDKKGRTCKIPDAKSFRPLTRKMVLLKKYPTQQIGQLIFVSFEPDPPSLETFLGPEMHASLQEWFSDDYQPTANFDEVIECNWKVIQENILETYHIETMHANTLKHCSPDKDSFHKFRENGNEFRMDYTNWGADRKMEWLISKWFDVEPRYDWRHMVRYPNLVIANSSLVTYVQSVVPTGPTTTNNIFRVFNYRGKARTLRNRMAAAALKIGAKRFVKKVLDEDSVVYPHIQKGVSAADRPGDGLISVREERIFDFQEYLLRQLGRTEEPEESTIAIAK